MLHRTPLIVALDFNDESSAFALVNQLDPRTCAVKVGSELFTVLGPDFVRTLVAKQFKVFLDLKFHDIPNTVAHACQAAAKLGVWMVNLHASGGLAMMQAAKQALQPFGDARPLLIAVTILTSMNAEEFLNMGVEKPLETHLLDLARLAHCAGLDGVVSSALEVAAIKEACGSDFLTVTPGIRFSNDAKDDQSRVATPEFAWREGSDFLVVGRSITRAPEPALVVHDILQTLHR